MTMSESHLERDDEKRIKSLLPPRPTSDATVAKRIFRGLIILLALVYSLYSLLPTQMSATPGEAEYRALSNLFVQATMQRNASFDVFDPAGYMGLISRDWSAFQSHIAKLNNEAPSGVAYKVLFVNRHGEGYHNVAESVYGKSRWDCYWSLKDGDGNITWGPDPELSALGVSQAEHARTGWEHQLQKGAPHPQLYITSPLTRSIDTMRITWTGLLPESASPLVMEKFRETIGLHTCDKRTTRSEIAKRFPDVSFEPGFTEEDTLWTRDSMEPNADKVYRVLYALDDLFKRPETCKFGVISAITDIAISCHSGIMQALFDAVHHQQLDLPPGTMVPLVIKSTPSTRHRAKPTEPRIRAPQCAVHRSYT